MDQGERGFHRGVGQIRVELLQLQRGQHPLVNDRLVGKAGDVEVVSRRGSVRARIACSAQLADDVQLALERQVVGDPVAAADEHLAHDGLARPARCRRASASLVGTVRQPSTVWPSSRIDLLEASPHSRGAAQDRAARRPCRRRRRPARQIDAGFGAHGRQKGVGQSATECRRRRPCWARSRSAPRWRRFTSTVERMAQNPVRPPAIDVDDKADAARVVLPARVVEGVVEQTWVGHVHKGSPLVSGLSAPGGLKPKGHPERIDAWVASSLSKNQRKIRVAASQSHQVGVNAAQR